MLKPDKRIFLILTTILVILPVIFLIAGWIAMKSAADNIFALYFFIISYAYFFLPYKLFGNTLFQLSAFGIFPRGPFGFVAAIGFYLICCYLLAVIIGLLTRRKTG